MDGITFTPEQATILILLLRNEVAITEQMIANPHTTHNARAQARRDLVLLRTILGKLA